MTNPVRGEIWEVQFEPAVGAEIRKTRPAVVVSVDTVGRLPLKMVVPITDWRPSYGDYYWFVRLIPNADNGLTKESGADTFQTKSLSTDRFLQKLGYLTDDEMKAIASAIALCVGFKP
jgi:mRNA interferase MazF